MNSGFEALAGVVALAGYVLLLLRFFSGERARGRFVGRPEPAVDEAWLRAKVFSLSPEEAGAAWLDSVTAFQVVAVIARLVDEGKLSKHVESTGPSRTARNVRLRLLAPLDRFDGYERALLVALFVDGTAETSTDRITEYYGQGKGRIVEAMTPALLARMARDPELRDVVAAPSLVRTALLFGVSAALFVSAGNFQGLFMASLFVWATSAGAWGVAAESSRTAIGGRAEAILTGVVALWPLGMGVVCVVMDRQRHTALFSGWSLVGLALMSLAVCSSVLNAARTRSGSGRNARRWAFAGPSSWGWRGALRRPLLHALARMR